MKDKNEGLENLNNDINNFWDSTGIGALFLDAEFRIRKFTPTMHSHFNLTPDDIGRNISNFDFDFPKEAGTVMITDAKSVLKTGIQQEKEIVNLDGKIFLKRITPLKTETGQIEGVIISFIDIDELKKTQLKLKKTESIYNSLFDNIDDGFLHGKIIKDKYGALIDWEFISTNKIYRKQTGLNDDEIAGKRVLEIFPDIKKHSIDWIKTYGETALTGTTQSIVNYNDLLNKHFLVRIFSPKKGEFAATFADVSEINEAKKSLEKERSFSQKITDTSPNGIYIFDAVKGTNIWSNKGYSAISGYTQDELTAMERETFISLFHPDDREALHLHMTEIIAGKQHSFEYRFKHKNGHWIGCYSIDTPFEYNEEGGVKSFIGIFIDVTKEKLKTATLEKSEAELKRTQKISHVGSWRLNIASNETIWSDELYSIFDLDPSTPPPEFPEGHLALFTKESGELLLATAQNSVENGIPYDMEVLTNPINGAAKWLRLKTEPVKNKLGETIELNGSTQDITLEKEKTAALIKSEEELKITQKITRIGNWNLNIATNQVTWSDHLFTIFGLDNSKPVPSYPEQETLFSAEGWRKLSAAVKECSENGTPYGIEIQTAVINGKSFWIHAKGESYRNSEGLIIGLRGSVQDITKSKWAQLKLKRSTQLLEASQSIAQIGGWELNLLTNELYWTAETYLIHETTPYEFNPTVDAGVGYFLPESRRIIKEALKTAIEEGKGYDLVLDTHTTKGKLITVRTTCEVTLINGIPRRLSGIFQDITESKKAELELRRNNHLLKTSQAIAMLGGWEFDVLTTKLFWTEEIYRIHETSPEEFIVTIDSALNLFPTDEKEKLEEAVQSALEGKDFDLELDTYTLKGKLIKIRIKCTVILDGDQPVKLMGVTQNITKQKQFQNELIAAKEKAESANTLKNKFLANMSHEIRTPMNSVIGFSDLLKNDDLSLEKRHNYIDIVENNSKQLLTLIDDIIDVSKIESDDMNFIISDCNVCEMITELEVVFNQRISDNNNNNKPNLKFKRFIPKDCQNLTIKTDRLRLYQVISNLLSNALKFSDKGTVSFGFNREGKHLAFFVKDEGIGISADKTTEIFQRFKQLNDKNQNFGGNGLGLAICRGIVHLLGGEIEVKSTLNVGSEFTFTIPFEEVQVVEDKKIEVKTKLKTFEGLTVLLAEDDSFIQLYFKEIMKLWKVNLLIADNGAEAVEMYKKHPEIELVLMDIRMPVMDGFEATSIILKLDPKAIIVTQSAHAMGSEKQKCMDLGCKGYLTKPIRKEKLLTVFENLIEV